MAGSDRRAKDAAMAAHMKKNGVTRTSARCPICHCLTALAQMYGHISLACKGPSKDGKS